MHRFLLPLLVVCGVSLPAADHLIPLATTTVDGTTLGIQPGDRILITAGARPWLTLQNVVGTAAAPVTVINSGGQVVLKNSDRWMALTITACHHLHLTGSGHAGYAYGFDVACTRASSHSVNVIGKSSDIEIDHVEISGAGFAGFNVKDEPKTDGSTNRGAFEMLNMHLHHNYVHNTGGEGFYVGHTFSNGWDNDNDASTPLLYPHFIRNLEIDHNLTRDTGCEGIQVGSTPSGLSVHDNVVENPGTDPFASYQNNGIQVGMSAGAVWNNVVRTAPGNGFIILTPGAVQMFNNVVDGCQGNGFYIAFTASSAGSLALGGLPAGPGFRVVHNTILNPGGNGTDSAITLRGGGTTDANVEKNNLAVATHGRFWSTYANSSNVRGGSTFLTTLAAAKFVDAANKDYRLTATSPARNTGLDVSVLGLTTVDADGLARVAESAPDAGAFEYQPPNTAPTVGNVSIPRYPLGATLTLRARASDADGNMQSVVFSHGTTRLGNGALNAATGAYEFAWTPTAVGTYDITTTATDTGGLASTFHLTIIVIP
jgi:hypothetical protein